MRLSPRAGADRVLGLARDADGRPLLRVAVAAPPVEGAANAALIGFLARRWKVPKSAITLVAGDTARVKRLRIEAEPETLARVAAELEERS